jgi:undecaprenyl diphosphate synthase
MEGKKVNCIGVIMDGNRRWAKGKGLSTAEGHHAGYGKLKEVVRWAGEKGISHAIFYAFSTENWNRSPEEVAGLMTLFEMGLRESLPEFLRDGVRVRFIGERERFSSELQTLMNEVEEKTAECNVITAVLALSYGGRSEITHAFNELLKGNKTLVTQEDIADVLWTKDIPDPDLIIRTSGEQRLSNFLPWQSVYSELFFTETLWPDFSKNEFEGILRSYAERDRRRGT